MMFMRFAIDAVFLGRPDADGTRPVVVRPRALPAWRGLVPLVRGAHGVLELPVGTIAASGTAVGDRIAAARAPRRRGSMAARVAGAAASLAVWHPRLRGLTLAVLSRRGLCAAHLQSASGPFPWPTGVLACRQDTAFGAEEPCGRTSNAIQDRWRVSAYRRRRPVPGPSGHEPAPRSSLGSVASIATMAVCRDAPSRRERRRTDALAAARRRGTSRTGDVRTAPSVRVATSQAWRRCERGRRSSIPDRRAALGEHVAVPSGSAHARRRRSGSGDAISDAAQHAESVGAFQIDQDRALALGSCPRSRSPIAERSARARRRVEIRAEGHRRHLRRRPCQARQLDDQSEHACSAAATLKRRTRLAQSSHAVLLDRPALHQQIAAHARSMRRALRGGSERAVERRRRVLPSTLPLSGALARRAGSWCRWPRRSPDRLLDLALPGPLPGLRARGRADLRGVPARRSTPGSICRPASRSACRPTCRRRSCSSSGARRSAGSSGRRSTQLKYGGETRLAVPLGAAIARRWRRVARRRRPPRPGAGPRRSRPASAATTRRS